MGFKHANLLPEGKEVIVDSEAAAKLATVGPFTIDKYQDDGRVQITDGLGAVHVVEPEDLLGLTEPHD